MKVTDVRTNRGPTCSSCISYLTPPRLSTQHTGPINTERERSIHLTNWTSTQTRRHTHAMMRTRSHLCCHRLQAHTTSARRYAARGDARHSRRAAEYLLLLLFWICSLSLSLLSLVMQGALQGNAVECLRASARPHTRAHSTSALCTMTHSESWWRHQQRIIYVRTAAPPPPPPHYHRRHRTATTTASPPPPPPPPTAHPPVRSHRPLVSCFGFPFSSGSAPSAT